jgi:hypothetical protein
MTIHTAVPAVAPTSGDNKKAIDPPRTRYPNILDEIRAAGFRLNGSQPMNQQATQGASNTSIKLPADIDLSHFTPENPPNSSQVKMHS